MTFKILRFVFPLGAFFYLGWQLFSQWPQVQLVLSHVGILYVGLAFLLVLPVFAGCESKQQKEENARLTQEVQTLTQAKSGLEAKAAQLARDKSMLEQQVAELEKKAAGREQKTAKKAPAKKPAARRAMKKK